MAYLGEKYKRTLCRRRRREGKDSESGHVMSYNQEVLQCTFTETLKEKDKNKNIKKKVVGSSTRHSKVDFILHNPVPLIEVFFFSYFFVLNVMFALLVNEVGMCVNDRVPYLT